MFGHYCSTVKIYIYEIFRTSNVIVIYIRDIDNAPNVSSPRNRSIQTTDRRQRERIARTARVMCRNENDVDVAVDTVRIRA